MTIKLVLSYLHKLKYCNTGYMHVHVSCDWIYMYISSFGLLTSIRLLIRVERVQYLKHHYYKCMSCHRIWCEQGPFQSYVNIKNIKNIAILVYFFLELCSARSYDIDMATMLL